MDCEIYLERHLRLHPSAQAQDILKFCYQRAFGAEHLLFDLSAARRYFFSEYERTEPAPGGAVEPLSDKIVRVHFAVWKALGADAECLFNAFVASAQLQNGGKDVFLRELDSVTRYLQSVSNSAMLAQWQLLLSEYDTDACFPVHHSPAFRNAERPAYRIVKSEFMKDIL